MSYDHAELEQIIRTGGKLPDELVEIFKKNAARRRSEIAGARRRKFIQYALGVGKARESSSWTPSVPRGRRDRPGRLSPNPVPAGDPPQSLACDQGFAMIGDTFAPFLWGSQEQPAYNSSPDGTHLSSTMTRRKTGEFSLALVVTSDPNDPTGQGASEILGFKGEEISASIGQLYVVAGQSPLLVQGQAQLAMRVPAWWVARFWLGDAYGVAGGSATITVSEFSIEWTLKGIKSELMGQNSIETDLFGWMGDLLSPGDDPYLPVYLSESYFTPGPLNLSVPMEHNPAATYAMVEVDIDIFGFTQTGTPKNPFSTKIDLAYRITDDDDLKVGPEDETDPDYGLYPYPSPIILTETRLCGFYPKPNP